MHRGDSPLKRAIPKNMSSEPVTVTHECNSLDDKKVMATQFDDADFVPLKECKLAWRWTKQSYDVLPADFLEQIQSLNACKARKIHEISRSNYNYWVPGRESLLHDRFENVATTDMENGEIIPSWLAARLPDKSVQIVISWDSTTAVVTTSTIFARYWDSFLLSGVRRRICLAV